MSSLKEESKMKYLLLGDDYQTLFVEDDEGFYSLRYDINNHKWVNGGTTLLDNRIGFDPSEPEDSIYRFGNSDCMKTIREISHHEAELFISSKIDEKSLIKKLESLKVHK